MRRGIGLRGYAQQDPLNEYKREAFELYDELRGLIRHGVASSIFRVTVTRQPQPSDEGGDPAVAAALARGAASLAGGNGANGRTAPERVAGSDAARVPAATVVGGSAILRGGPAAPPTNRPMRATLGDQLVTGDGVSPTADGPKAGFTPSGARIGRNDPCWCGSGAKYKKCHGR